mmetsp:Transcript_36007/g.87008  ORF Transcript_36007/g.87008 Transcript_36007/m.87008 type:complete len:240 (-) Transcript_36007:172-891(-)
MSLIAIMLTRHRDSVGEDDDDGQVPQQRRLSKSPRVEAEQPPWTEVKVFRVLLLNVVVVHNLRELGPVVLVPLPPLRAHVQGPLPLPRLALKLVPLVRPLGVLVQYPDRDLDPRELLVGAVALPELDTDLGARRGRAHREHVVLVPLCQGAVLDNPRLLHVVVNRYPHVGVLCAELGNPGEVCLQNANLDLKQLDRRVVLGVLRCLDLLVFVRDDDNEELDRKHGPDHVEEDEIGPRPE